MVEPRILILGPPGAGKGTQSANIASEYGIKHIATGDMLRDNKDMETAYGTPREYMEAGELVPDEVMEQVVEQALANVDGFVLDGYPRTLVQAKYLDDVVTFDIIVYLEVDRDELVRRLSGRRVDPETGENYHIEFDMPEETVIRDRLIQRTDDSEETVRERLRVYEAQTTPVIAHYEGRSSFEPVDGHGTPEEVWDRIRERIDQNI